MWNGACGSNYWPSSENCLYRLRWFSPPRYTIMSWWVQHRVPEYKSHLNAFEESCVLCVCVLVQTHKRNPLHDNLPIFSPKKGQNMRLTAISFCLVFVCVVRVSRNDFCKKYYIIQIPTIVRPMLNENFLIIARRNFWVVYLSFFFCKIIRIQRWPFPSVFMSVIATFCCCSCVLKEKYEVYKSSHQAR